MATKTFPILPHSEMAAQSQKGVQVGETFE